MTPEIVNGCELYLGDCLDILPTLAAGSVDAIITDLPYGTTACAWDEVIPFDSMWEQVKRLLKKRGAFVTTASQPFTSFLILSNLQCFKYETVWEKNTGTRFLDAKERPLNFHENILLFCDGQSTYNPQKYKGESNHSRKNTIGELKKISIYRSGLVETQSDESGYKYPRSVVYCPSIGPSLVEHPTQKPVALYEYLIKTYTNPNDTVLDFCMGSGTTGVACIQTGRRFIGIEKDERYFEIACKRILQAQPPLFVDAPAEPVATQLELTK